MIKKILLSGLLSTSAMAADPVHFSPQPVTIDGKALEQSWQKANWFQLDQVIIGDKPAAEDFSGRYKLLWDKDYLYILLEVTDDILSDQYTNPLEKYWDDECVEVFIDEDASGGDHLANFNAFAYHVALDGQVVDLVPDGERYKPALLNSHIVSKWRQTDKNNTVWELAVRVYDDSFSMSTDDKPVTLAEDKEMGFMLAYCDNDGTGGREHFIGSKDIAPVNGDKNLGYKDATVFGKIILKN